MLALLVAGITWVAHSNQRPAPSPVVKPAVYIQVEVLPDTAPRAELIAMPAQQATPVRVLRATLVRLPNVRRATLAKW